MNSTVDFFKNLPNFTDPSGVSDPANYHPVPRDWTIFLTDIEGSTKAIEAGRYKEVNLVGVAGITAVKNACRGHAFPYVFGGDGATFVVPPEMVVAARQALLGTRTMAANEFRMDLRVAEISLSDPQLASQSLGAGKYKVSPDLEMAVFAGNALSAAELIAKDPVKGKAYRLDDAAAATADFTGLECRWQPIPAKKGEMISVLIKAREGNAVPEPQIYREVMAELDDILGRNRYDRVPVARELMKVVTHPAGLLSEIKVRTMGRSVAVKARYLVNAYLAALLGKWWFRFRSQAFGVDWGKYQDEVVANSDFWKYDEMLRFVADVTTGQKEQLVAWLRQREARGELFYGIHSSRAALMTCLVADRQGDHVHFIDGGDGGYAMAAKQLKSQIKSSSQE